MKTGTVYFCAAPSCPGIEGQHPEYLAHPCGDSWKDRRHLRAARARKKHTARTVGKRLPRVRAKVWARDGGVCRCCGVVCTHELGSPRQGTLDHIVPAAAGGRFELPNLQLLCQRCNNAKGCQRPSVQEATA